VEAANDAQTVWVNLGKHSMRKRSQPEKSIETDTVVSHRI